MEGSCKISNSTVSIIICTRNRADSLHETLEAMRDVKAPDRWRAELLVVDNGSTDGTRDVIDRCNLTHMTLRYIHEPRAGQCWARNRGLVESSGDAILFTDDDVRPPVDWLSGMCDPILSGEADAVAGGIVLAAHLERPWLRGHVRTMVATTDALGSGTRVHLVGANMAFGRHVLEIVPLFDPELGPGALGFGDEALFCFQLKQNGFRLLARWEVAVEHHCDASRMNRAAFVKIAEQQGRSQAYLAYHWEHREVPVPLAQRWLTTAKLFLRELGTINRQKTDAPLPWECAYISRVAFMKQYMLERRRRRNYERHGLRKLRGVLAETASE